MYAKRRLVLIHLMVILTIAVLRPSKGVAAQDKACPDIVDSGKTQSEVSLDFCSNRADYAAC